MLFYFSKPTGVFVFSFLPWKVPWHNLNRNLFRKPLGKSSAVKTSRCKITLMLPSRLRLNMANVSHWVFHPKMKWSPFYPPHVVSNLYAVVVSYVTQMSQKNIWTGMRFNVISLNLFKADQCTWCYSYRLLKNVKSLKSLKLCKWHALIMQVWNDKTAS